MTTLRSSETYVWLDPTDKVGKGATGLVFKCRHKTTGELYAVKTFNEASAAQQIREVDILMNLEHRNVMKLVAKEKEKNSTVIIMEYCAGGSVLDMLDQPENACGLQDDELILFLTDTIAALKYLRERRIVHRDLKPGNILKYIDADGQTFYKLTDFGAARGFVGDDDEFKTITGTEEYLHPNMHERYVKRNYGYARFGPSCDLWSLGVTIYHVATGRLPFRPFGGRTEQDKMLEITKGKKTGIISGVQLVANGPVIYSDKLPNTCRLTNALRQLVTPMLAGLMESKDSEMWKFERLYSFAEKLRAMRYVDLFVMPACTFDRVYFQSELFLAAQRPAAAAAPLDSRDAVSVHAPPMAMDPVASPKYPKCTRVIKQYISSQYVVDASECGLIIPTLTEQFIRGGAALLGASGYGSSQNVPYSVVESVKVATDAELVRVTVSLEHTRVRVALSERAASKTWSASAVLSAAFANSDADVDVATAGFGLGASMKQYVVAMRILNVPQITDMSKFNNECISKLDSPNTMMYDLRATVNQVLDQQAGRDEALIDTRSQTAFVYSTFLASAALSDAQMLYCATVNYFVVYVESIMNALRERANALNETNRQIRQTLQVFNAFITSQAELLKLCKREYALLDQVIARQSGSASANLMNDELDVPINSAQESDSFPVRAPHSLRDALEKLSSVPTQLEKLEKDCNARLKEVNGFVSKYYEVIVTKDELRNRWHSKVADKLCFGECLTASLTTTGNADANAKTDLTDEGETHTLPCWKRLQTYYEQCTALHSALQTKYNSSRSLSKVVECDRRLLRKRAEVSQSHVFSHCWLRTQQCYSSFIEWQLLLEGATKRIETLRVLIERNSSEQRDALKKLANLCEEVKHVCEQFYADEKRNVSSRSTANGAGENLKKRSVQTAQTQTDGSLQSGQYDVSVFSTMNSKIDTILREMDAVHEFLDTSENDSMEEN